MDERGWSMARWTRLGAVAAVLAGTVALAGDERPAGSLRMEPDAALLKAGESRTFTVTYRGTVKGVPADAKKLRVWLPVPQDSGVQTIRSVDFPGPVAPRITFEKRFGNKLACW